MTVSTRSVAVIPSCSAPVSLKPTTSGNEHRYGLAEHRRLRLDPADAPAEHAHAVDHRRVAVGADERVGIGDRLAVLRVLAGLGRGPYRLRDIFEVDLVADAGARRHDLEIVERLGAPFQELVALHVALIFQLDIVVERLGGAELVDHDAMVDDEVAGHLRVDLGRVATELGNRVAHRGEIDDAGDAGEILHENACRAVLDLAVGVHRIVLPIDDRLDVVGGDRDAVLEAQHVLQEHLHREGQAADVAELRRGLGEAVIGVGLAVHVERGAGAERVLADRGHAGPSLGCGPGGRTVGPSRSRMSPRGLSKGGGVGEGCVGGGVRGGGGRRGLRPACLGTGRNVTKNVLPFRGVGFQLATRDVRLELD